VDGEGGAGGAGAGPAAVGVDGGPAGGGPAGTAPAGPPPAFTVLYPGLGTADPDVPWQLADGRLSFARFAHGAFGPPLHDVWSWTAAGWPWHPNGWGFDLLLYDTFRLAGWAGVAGLRVAFLVVIALGLWKRSAAFGAPRAARAAGTSLCVVLLTTFSAPRPQLASFALTLLALEVAERYMDRRLGHLALAGTFVLFGVWASTHGAVVGGVAIAVAVAGGAALENRRGVDWARAAALAVAALAGSCAGVLGPSVWPYAVSTRGKSQMIAEWAHFAPTSFGNDVFVGLGLAALAWTLRRRHWAAAGAIAVGLALGVDAVRNEVFILLTGVGALSAICGLGGGLRRARAAKVGAALAGLVLLAAAFVAGAPARNMDLAGPNPRLVPVAQIEALPQGCRLLNSYDLGGWVIWLRPGLRVSQDPRNDMYGAPMIDKESAVLAGGPGAMGWVVDHHVTCVIARPRTRLFSSLRRAGWRLLSAGPAGQAWVRRR
jgi:hypothetical protein